MYIPCKTLYLPIAVNVNWNHTRLLCHKTYFERFTLKKVSLNYCSVSRDILTLKDGGDVALDWLRLEGATDETPVVVILPGLTGSSETDYIKGIVLQCRERRIRAVVFMNRGIGGITLKVWTFHCCFGSSSFNICMFCNICFQSFLNINCFTC